MRRSERLGAAAATAAAVVFLSKKAASACCCSSRTVVVTTTPVPGQCLARRMLPMKSWVAVAPSCQPARPLPYSTFAAPSGSRFARHRGASSSHDGGYYSSENDAASEDDFIAELRRRSQGSTAAAAVAVPFTKAGGKCDATDARVFMLLLSFLEQQPRPIDIRLGGGWVRDRLLYPNMLHRGQGMDFIVAGVPGPVFGQQLAEYARKRHKTKHPDYMDLSDIKVQELQGNRWTMWYSGRELRFEQRIMDSWEEEMLFRTDFTINALLYRLQDQTVEDYTGQGLNDAANRLLRTTYTPYNSLWYDPVRILRTIRLRRAYRLRLDQPLAQAMGEKTIRDRFISSSHVARRELELRKMIMHKYSALMLSDLAHIKLHETLFKFSTSLSSIDPEKGAASAPASFSSLPPLAAELNLPVNPWTQETTRTAVSSVEYLYQVSREMPSTSRRLALLLAFVSPALLANWSGYSSFGSALAGATVNEIKRCTSLPEAYAKELFFLLQATMSLLHIAHDFIPVIHACHHYEGSEDGDLSVIESSYKLLVHHRRHDILHWLRNHEHHWQLATLLGHTMLVHGSPRYHFDTELFQRVLQENGVVAAAYGMPLLDGNEIKALLPRDIPTKRIGELKKALVSWQWEETHPTKEGATAFVLDHIDRLRRGLPPRPALRSKPVPQPPPQLDWDLGKPPSW